MAKTAPSTAQRVTMVPEMTDISSLSDYCGLKSSASESPSDLRSDSDLVSLLNKAKYLDVAIRSVLVDDNRDTDEIDGFAATCDELAVLVDAICATDAITVHGLMSKAHLADYFSFFAGETASRLAMAVVRDLMRFSSQMQSGID